MVIINNLLAIFQKTLDVFSYLFSSNLNEKKYLEKKIGNNNNIVVFDVGANLGSFSKNIYRIFPKININLHLFEPNKLLITKLKQNFGQSKINEVAISDQNNRSTLFISNISSQSSLLKDNSFIGKDVGEQIVETIRLDDYIANENIEKINLLKIDVEGFELNVLLSLGEYLKSKKIELIKIEISFQKDNNFNTINSILNQSNYFLDGFTNVKYLKNKILFLDAYFSLRS